MDPEGRCPNATAHPVVTKPTSTRAVELKLDEPIF